MLRPSSVTTGIVPVATIMMYWWYDYFSARITYSCSATLSLRGLRQARHYHLSALPELRPSNAAGLPDL